MTAFLRLRAGARRSSVPSTGAGKPIDWAAVTQLIQQVPSRPAQKEPSERLATNVADKSSARGRWIALSAWGG